MSAAFGHPTLIRMSYLFWESCKVSTESINSFVGRALGVASRLHIVQPSSITEPSTSRTDGSRASTSSSTSTTWSDSLVAAFLRGAQHGGQSCSSSRADLGSRRRPRAPAAAGGSQAAASGVSRARLCPGTFATLALGHAGGPGMMRFARRLPTEPEPFEDEYNDDEFEDGEWVDLDLGPQEDVEGAMTEAEADAWMLRELGVYDNEADEWELLEKEGEDEGEEEDEEEEGEELVPPPSPPNPRPRKDWRA